MALVHIIGDLQPAEELAQQLRDHGHEIEILPPGTQSSSAADLEINLEQCSADVVISKALAMAQEQNACLFVSPGIAVPTGDTRDSRDADVASAGCRPPALDSEFRNCWRLLKIYWRTDILFSIKHVGENSVRIKADALRVLAEISRPMRHYFNRVVGLIHTCAVRVVVTSMEKSRIVARYIQIPPNLAGSLQKNEPCEITEGAAPQHLDSAPGSTVDLARPHAAQTSPKVLPDPIFEEVAQTDEADEIELSAPQAASNWNEIIKPPESSPQLYSGLPGDRIHVPQSAAQPISQSNYSDASDWPIWQIADQEAAASEPFVNPLPAKQSTGSYSILLWNARRALGLTSSAFRRALDDRRFVSVAAATAAIAIFGLLLAASFHRFSPLPSQLINGSSLASQPAPFQKARPEVNSGAPASGEPLVPTQAPAPKAQTHAANVLRASHQLTQAASDDAGLIAKDIVIRYDSRSASRHVFSEPAHPGVKYYSDLSPTTR